LNFEDSFKVQLFLFEIVTTCCKETAREVSVDESYRRRLASTYFKELPQGCQPEPQIKTICGSG